MCVCIYIYNMEILLLLAWHLHALMYTKLREFCCIRDANYFWYCKFYHFSTLYDIHLHNVLYISKFITHCILYTYGRRYQTNSKVISISPPKQCTSCEWLVSAEIYRKQLKNKKPTRCHMLSLFFFLDTEHVSGINMPIFRSLRLCCWTTALADFLLVFAVCWS